MKRLVDILKKRIEKNIDDEENQVLKDSSNSIFDKIDSDLHDDAYYEKLLEKEIHEDIIEEVKDLGIIGGIFILTTIIATLLLIFNRNTISKKIVKYISSSPITENDTINENTSCIKNLAGKSYSLIIMSDSDFDEKEVKFVIKENNIIERYEDSNLISYGTYKSKDNILSVNDNLVGTYQVTILDNCSTINVKINDSEYQLDME